MVEQPRGLLDVGAGLVPAQYADFRSPCWVGAVSNCADAVRLETAPTGVIARIFPVPIGKVS